MDLQLNGRATAAVFHPLLPRAYVAVGPSAGVPSHVDVLDARGGGRMARALLPRNAAAPIASLAVSLCCATRESGGLLVATLSDGRAVAWDLQNLVLLGTVATPPAVDGGCIGAEWLAVAGASAAATADDAQHWYASCRVGAASITLRELVWSTAPAAGATGPSATAAALLAAPRALVATAVAESGGGAAPSAPPAGAGAGGCTALAWGARGIVAAAWSPYGGSCAVSLWRLPSGHSAAALAPALTERLPNSAPIAMLRLVTATHCEVLSGGRAGAAGGGVGAGSAAGGSAPERGARAALQLLLALDERGAFSAYRLTARASDARGGASIAVQPLMRSRSNSLVRFKQPRLPGRCVRTRNSHLDSLPRTILNTAARRLRGWWQRAPHLAPLRRAAPLAARRWVERGGVLRAPRRRRVRLCSRRRRRAPP